MWLSQDRWLGSSAPSSASLAALAPDTFVAAPPRRRAAALRLHRDYHYIEMAVWGCDSTASLRGVPSESICLPVPGAI